MEVMKKLKELIKVSFSAEEQSQLAEYAKPLEVKMAELMTKDGKKLTYSGESLSVGVEIMDATGETPVPCMDGEYMLEDGTVIKCVCGKVAEIATPAAETEEQMAARKLAEQSAPAIAQMSVQFESLKSENEALKVQLSKRLENIEKANVFLASQLEKILNAEVQLSAQSTQEPTPDFSKMTMKEEVEWKRKHGLIK